MSFQQEEELEQSIKREKIKVIELNNELEQMKNKFGISQQQNMSLQQEIDILQQRLFNQQENSQDFGDYSAQQQQSSRLQKSQQSNNNQSSNFGQNNNNNSVNQFQNQSSQLQSFQQNQSNFYHDEYLNQQLEEKDEVISRLNAKVSQVKMKEQNLLEENAKIEQMYNDLVQEFQQFRENTKNNRIQNQKLENQDHELIGGIYGSNSKQYQQTVEQAIGNEKIMAKKLEITTQLKQKLEQDNIQLKADLENQYRDIEILKEQNNNLEQELIDFQKRVENDRKLLEEKMELQEKVDLNEKMVEKFQNEVQTLKKQQKEEIQLIQEQQKQAQSYADQYKLQIEDLLEEIRNVQSRSQDKDKRIQGLQEEKFQIERSLKQAQDEKQQLSQLNDKLENELNEISNTMTTLNDKTKYEFQKRDTIENKMGFKVEQLESEILHLEKINIQVQNEKNGLEERVQAIEKEKRQLEEQLKNIQDLREDEVQLHMSKEKLLNSQLQQLKQDVQDISERLYIQKNQGQNKNRRSKSQNRDKINSLNYNSLNNQDEGQVSTQRKQFKPPKQGSVKKNSSLSSRHNQSAVQYNSPGKFISQQQQQNNQQSSGRFESPLREREEFVNQNQISNSSLQFQIQQLKNNEREMQMEVQTKDLELIQLKHRVQKQEQRIQNLLEQQHVFDMSQSKYQSQIQDKAMIIEGLKKENDILKIQTHHVDAADAKLLDELNELRNVKNQLLIERERILQDLELKEDENFDERKMKDDLIYFIQSLENKCLRYSQEINHIVKEQQNNQDYYQQEINSLQQNKEDLIEMINEKEEIIRNLQEELKGMEYKLEDERNQAMQQMNQVQIIEKDKDIEVNAHKLRMQEIKEECENSHLSMAILKEEMLEQNRKHNESIEINKQHIKILKEIFQNQVTDLRKQVSKGKIKDKLAFDKIVISLTDSFVSPALKEANVKVLKEKISKFEKQAKMYKAQQQNLFNIIGQLKDELQNCHKNMSTFKIQKSQKKIEEICVNLGNINEGQYQQQNQGKDMKQEYSVSQAQLLAQKTNNKMLNEELNYLKEENALLQEKVSESQKIIENFENEKQNIQKENDNNKKQRQILQGKLESQKSQLEEKENILQKSQSQQQNLQDSNSIKEIQQNLESKIKELKEDLNRKKEIISGLKSQKEEKEYELNQVKSELEVFKEESEKYKKIKGDLQRKDQMYKDLKERYEKLKDQEKKLQEELVQNGDKLKMVKNESLRKELQLKEMREKNLNESISHANIKQSLDEENKHKELTKKLKTEINNKEIFIRNLKQKLEMSIFELEKYKTEGINKTTENMNELERESRKADNLKNQLKKVQSQYDMLVFLLKRIFRENFVSYQKNQQKIIQQQQQILQQQQQQQQQYKLKQNYSKQSSQQNASKFSESLNILNLSPDDINQFLDPQSQNQGQNFGNQSQNLAQNKVLQQQQQQLLSYQGIIEKFEQELEKKENVNINNIYQMISSLIDDRITQGQSQ